MALPSSDSKTPELIEFEVIVRFRSRDIKLLKDAEQLVKDSLDDPCREFTVEGYDWEAIE